MFKWIKDFFNRNKNIRENVKLLDKYFEDRFEVLRDELVLLRKLCVQRPHKIISTIYGGCHFRNRTERDKAIEAERENLRAEGYSYCHIKDNGEEVWAKYE